MRIWIQSQSQSQLTTPYSSRTMWIWIQIQLASPCSSQTLWIKIKIQIQLLAF